MQSNGAIVAGGAFTNSSSDQEFFAERITAAGVPDTSFGSNGFFEKQIGASSSPTSEATGVIAQSNGDLALSAVISSTASEDQVGVVRLTSSGQLDSSFGTNGVADDQPSTATSPNSLPFGITTTQDGGYAVTGGAFLSGATAPAPTVVQFTSAGALDSSFGSDGVFTYSGNGDVGIGTAIETEPDGKLVVSGVSVVAGSSSFQDLILRLNTNGTLDSSFGSDGAVTGTPASTALSIPYAATLTPDGDVLLSGEADNESTPNRSSFLQEISLDTAPTVDIAYAPTSVEAGVPVTFSEVAVSPDGESISSVNWDLGSGSFTDATGTTVTKTFVTAGTYTVRVRVTDSYGLSTTETQTVTVAAAPTVTAKAPTTLSPTVAVAPKLKLVSAKVSGDRIRLKLSCTFAACHVTSSLTTLEHLLAGRTRSLSTSGHGKHTKTVEIASGKLVIMPGKTATLTLKLDATGVSLLKSFNSLPAKATIKLINGKPVTTLHRSLKVTIRQTSPALTYRLSHVRGMSGSDQI